MSKREFLSVTGVAIMAVGCAGLQPDIPNWLGWLGIGAILAGAIVVFVANNPPRDTSGNNSSG